MFFFTFIFKVQLSIMVCVAEVDILVLHKYVIVLTIELNMVTTQQQTSIQNWQNDPIYRSYYWLHPTKYISFW